MPHKTHVFTTSKHVHMHTVYQHHNAWFEPPHITICSCVPLYDYMPSGLNMHRWGGILTCGQCVLRIPLTQIKITHTHE